MAVKRFVQTTFLLLLLSYRTHQQSQPQPNSKFLPNLFTTIQATLGGYSPFAYLPRPVGPFPAVGYRPGDVNFAYSYPFVPPVPQQSPIHFTRPTRTHQNVPLPTTPTLRDEMRQQPAHKLPPNSDNGVAKLKHPAPPPPMAMLPPSIDNRYFHEVRLVQPPSVASSENSRKEIPLEKFHKPVFVDPSFKNSKSRIAVTPPPAFPAVPLKPDSVFIRHKNPQGGYSSKTRIENTKHADVSSIPVQPTRILPHITKGQRPFNNFKPIPSRPKPFPSAKPVSPQLTETQTLPPEAPKTDNSVNFIEEKIPKSTTQTDSLFTSAGMSHSTFENLADKYAKTKVPTILKEETTQTTQTTQEEISLSSFSNEKIQGFTTKAEINPETPSPSIISELPDEHQMAVTKPPSPQKEEHFVSDVSLPPLETKSVMPSSEVDRFDDTSSFGNWAFGDNKVLTGTPEEILALKLADAINNFGFELYRKLQGTNNLFFSPFSLSVALSIVLEGATNMTAVQMMNGLHFSESNIRPEEVKVGFKRLMKSLKSKRSDYQFENANLLLLQDKFAFKSQFSNTVYRHYKPLLGSVNFAADGLNIKRNVNDWVKRRTHGKIGEFLTEQLPPETVFAVLNAVYFRGRWLKPFDSTLTSTALFYNNGKDPTEITMMKQTSFFFAGYSEYLNSHIIELPYEGEETSMVIVLPEERDGIYKLKNKLNYQELYVILSEIEFQMVRLSLPKFSLRSRYDMEDILKEMGMKDVFISGKANFGRMTNVTGVYLSKVSHEGVIDVDEKGTEAAASTGGFVVPLSKPRPIIVDHPFFFFIRNRNNGAILFIGQFDAFDA